MVRNGLFALVAGLALIDAGAQTTAPTDFDLASRQAVINRLVAEMNDRYVFPGVARDAGREVVRQSEALRGIDDPDRFADRLTDVLRGVTHDKHIRVLYSARPVADEVSGKPSPARLAQERREAERLNNGVDRVERLPGNIGYIEIRGFLDPEWASESITAAMTLVAHADALIIDLRRNGGGEPETVAFMSSYLFDKKTHLNDLFWRDGNRTEEFWTRADVPGPRFGADKPVYVLTSSRTFSGAEEFSYNLKNLHRATLIGETTGGGANPGDLHKLSAHFEVFIPEGRAVNPITRTNWEGVGVAPDVAVPAARALDAAQAAALTRLLTGESDPQRKHLLETRLAEIQASLAKSTP